MIETDLENDQDQTNGPGWVEDVDSKPKGDLQHKEGCPLCSLRQEIVGVDDVGLELK